MVAHWLPSMTVWCETSWVCMESILLHRSGDDLLPRRSFELGSSEVMLPLGESSNDPLGRENLGAAYKTSGLAKDSRAHTPCAVRKSEQTPSHIRKQTSGLLHSPGPHLSALRAGRAGEKFYGSHCLI